MLTHRRPLSARRSTRNAFTLLEVLLVLAILVVLASLAVGVFGGAQKRANRNVAQSETKLLSEQCKFYKLDVGSWPQSLEELKNDSTGNPNWNGPYLKKDSLNDPWGQPYTIAGPDQYDEDLIIVSTGSGEEIASSNGG